MALDATGNSVLALTRTLNGTANLTGRQGSLVGWNVEQLLRRLERRPLSGTGDFRNGRTPFEKLTADFKITDGIATVETRQPGRLEGPARACRLGLDTGARFRSARGRGAGLRQLRPTRRRRSNCRSWCRARGTIRSCCRTPRALLARSPVASPLLNAVRNRNTRDTVRSAIERLTGGAVSPPAGAPTAAPKP